MEYTLNTHKNRFAVWTAARAVQRSWCTTSKISQVIAAVQLYDFAMNYKLLNNQVEYDAAHKKICNSIIHEFKLLNIPSTYGRAAKIVAVYMKTFVIIDSSSDQDKIRFIHPPVDRILLKNLPDEPVFKEIKKLSWTNLDEEKYWSMVKTIRDKLNAFDWRLEILWTPELENLHDGE